MDFGDIRDSRFHAFDDQRVWDLSGFMLDHIGLDYRVTLVFGQTCSSLTVVIEAPFTATTPPLLHHIEPERVATTAPLLMLLNDLAGSLTVYRDGLLRLTFESGAEIVVEKDDLNASWRTFGDGEITNANMECLPDSDAPWQD